MAANVLRRSRRRRRAGGSWLEALGHVGAATADPPAVPDDSTFRRPLTTATRSTCEFTIGGSNHKCGRNRPLSHVSLASLRWRLAATATMMDAYPKANPQMHLRQITAMIGPVELWQAEPKPLLGNAKIETRRQVSANHVLVVLFKYSQKPTVLRAERTLLWLVPKRKQPWAFSPSAVPCACTTLFGPRFFALLS